MKIIQMQVDLNYIYFLTDDGKIYSQERFGEEERKEIITS